MLRAHHLVHIMVATVEKFQAKERPIIIVSTTRSQMGGIGFLRDPKVSYYIYIYGIQQCFYGFSLVYITI